MESEMKDEDYPFIYADEPSKCGAPIWLGLGILGLFLAMVWGVVEALS